MRVAISCKSWPQVAVQEVGYQTWSKEVRNNIGLIFSVRTNLYHNVNLIMVRCAKEVLVPLRAIQLSSSTKSPMIAAFGARTHFFLKIVPFIRTLGNFDVDSVIK